MMRGVEPVCWANGLKQRVFRLQLQVNPLLSPPFWRSVDLQLVSHILQHMADRALVTNENPGERLNQFDFIHLTGFLNLRESIRIHWQISALCSARNYDSGDDEHDQRHRGLHPGAQGHQQLSCSFRGFEREYQLSSVPPSPLLRWSHLHEDIKDKILSWLEAPDFQTIYHSVLGQRVGETGAWFTQTHEFRSWLGGKGSVLWVSGIRKRAL